MRPFAIAITIAVAAIAALAAPAARADDEAERADGRTVAGWIERLASRSERERREAATALAGAPTSDAVLDALVVAAFDDADRGVRVAALGAIAAHGEAAARLTPRLIDIIERKRESPPVAREEAAAAARALGRIGEAASAAVARLEELRDASGSLSELQHEAAVALWRITGEADRAVPRLLALARTRDAILIEGEATTAERAVAALGEIGPDAAEAADLLAIHLRDARDEPLRVASATALGSVGRAGGDAGEGANAGLVAALSDRRAAVRAAAVRGLGILARDDVLPHLIARLADDAETVTAAATEVIRARPADRRGELVAAFGSIADRRVLTAIMRILAGFGDEAVAPLVAGLAADRPSAVRAWSATTLAELGEAAAPAIDALRAAVGGGDSAVAEQAARALGALGASAAAAVPELSKALGGDPAVAAAAADALGKVGEPARAARPALVVALSSPSARLRASAAWSIGLTGAPPDDATEEALNRAARDDESDAVRNNAVRSLGRIGARSRETIATLRRALRDDDAKRRANAAWSARDLVTVPKTLIRDLERAAERDDDLDVREAAKAALGKVVPD